MTFFLDIFLTSNIIDLDLFEKLKIKIFSMYFINILLKDSHVILHVQLTKIKSATQCSSN